MLGNVARDELANVAMKQITRILQSSLGKKFIMAVTGLALLGFVIGHLLGNLQIFLPGSDGALNGEALNGYAHKLKSMPALLWTARIGLLVIVVAHIVTAVQLTRENRKARGSIAYAEKSASGASYASRTMIWSGLIIASFIVYHLLHFTTLTLDPSYADFRTADGHHDVFKMVVTGFSNPFVSGFYILSVGLLCVHLSHGVKAMFQSLGLTRARWESAIGCVAQGLAWIIFVGNSSIPLAVLAGVFGK